MNEKRILHQIMIVFVIALLGIIITLCVVGSAHGDEPIYGVEVTADDIQDEAEPGESVIYQVEVRNDGNVNDTYTLYITNGVLNMSARDWCDIQGLPENDTIIIQKWETVFINIEVAIPDFTPECDDAMRGSYDFRVVAQSHGNGSVTDDIIFELEVEQMYKVAFWSDFPGKNELIRANENIDVIYTLNVRNLGNTDDEIKIFVPTDFNNPFSGNAKFGTQTYKNLNLDTLEQTQVELTIIVKRATDPGNYRISVKAESQGDTSASVYISIYLNLTKATFGLALEKVGGGQIRKVNPADESELEFKFTLTNTGDVNDTYTVEVETPLGSGTYKDWRMEFETNEEERVDQISVPADISWNMDCSNSRCGPPPFDDELPKNIRVDITLYVTVALDEDEGFYEDIAISATSDNDPARMEFIYFNLTVILPNIKLSDDPDDFYIEPDSEIEEDDSIDISLRVYNDGSAETDKFYVVFYNGKRNSPNEQYGHAITFETVDNIPGNSYTDILVTWDEIPGGENDIYAYADKPIRSGTASTKDNYGTYQEDGLVLESRENDNTASIDDVFQDAIDLRPDLIITDIEFEDNEVDKDQIITVTIANVGYATAEVGSAEVSVKAGGELLKEARTNIINPALQEEIDPGDDITMEFKWTPDEEKNYTIKAAVDYHGEISSHGRRTEYINIEAPPHFDGPPRFDKELLCFGWILGVITVIIIMSFWGPVRNERTRRSYSKPKPISKEPYDVKMPKADRQGADGMKKRRPYSKPRTPSSSTSPSTWTCSRCGNKWSADKGLCWNCGKKREN